MFYIITKHILDIMTSQTHSNLENSSQKLTMELNQISGLLVPREGCKNGNGAWVQRGGLERHIRKHLCIVAGRKSFKTRALELKPMKNQRSWQLEANYICTLFFAPSCIWGNCFSAFSGHEYKVLTFPSSPRHYFLSFAIFTSCFTSFYWLWLILECTWKFFPSICWFEKVSSWFLFQSCMFSVPWIHWIQNALLVSVTLGLHKP